MTIETTRLCSVQYRVGVSQFISLLAYSAMPMTRVKVSMKSELPRMSPDGAFNTRTESRKSGVGGGVWMLTQGDGGKG